VSQASVEVGGQTIGGIGKGMMVLVCAERGDGKAEAERLLGGCFNIACFPTPTGR
jgi:D-tyrosyl-tRNA(Tyr) deacylase